jgi:small subunit ribosomal protein S6
MPLYESVFIARQDISAQQVETLSDQFSELVSQNGGEVKKREYWGLRNLAYRIKKNRKGHYVLFNLDAPPAALTEMERNMRINEDVLRYQSVRIEEIEEGPSPIMAAKGRRDRDSVSPYEGMEP